MSTLDDHIQFLVRQERRLTRAREEEEDIYLCKCDRRKLGILLANDSNRIGKFNVTPFLNDDGVESSVDYNFFSETYNLEFSKAKTIQVLDQHLVVQYASCRQCGKHLGLKMLSPAPQFQPQPVRRIQRIVRVFPPPIVHWRFLGRIVPELPRIVNWRFLEGGRLQVPQPPAIHQRGHIGRVQAPPAAQRRRIRERRDRPVFAFSVLRREHPVVYQIDDIDPQMQVPVIPEWWIPGMVGLNPCWVDRTTLTRGNE